MTNKTLTIKDINFLMEINSKAERINQLTEWNASLKEINIWGETLEKWVNSKHRFTVEQEDSYIKMSWFLYTAAAWMACKLKFPTELLPLAQGQWQINKQSND